MEANLIETDYLIIGAGAMAMAFVDTLLKETNAQIVMVDRHDRPGGHWNDAYPFVRLHQPSAFYGVNSRELGSGTKDHARLNEGLYELASGAEVVSYYDQVMNQQFLPSGRVRYFPMCNYTGDGIDEHRFTSLVSGANHQVQVDKKVVDATHAQTAVPSTHPPRYKVEPGVQCVPLNNLPKIQQPHASYVVVGSGKTGIDACLWCLQNGIAPEKICWIMPSDPWLIDRANLQPGLDNFERTIGGLTAQLKAIAAADSIPDLFARLEASGQLLRMDKSVDPTAYRCATVTQAELSELRRIDNIVRLGKVQVIEPTRIVLEQGSIATSPNALHIDCSASGIPTMPDMKVFDGSKINLWMLSSCQPLFSAALIAYVESHLDDQAQMNALCTMVPTPHVPTDWIRMWAVYLGNQLRWGEHEGLTHWIRQSRLYFLTAVVRGFQVTDTEKLAQLHRLSVSKQQALTNLPRLLESIA
ncbi:NAD(P)/FAD-dependent oxidoreductase [Pseudomonas sp. A-R-19]|uniref:NAD(P)/FAD-dependent oxidoreductase n=1 Tax=Pseudomonas sp. A-R-19 TaxID=2832403 RepID=UPI001CBFBB14|nr:NAD(P)/FAD-dependent oxidoreductase [Pseudomonas sp. A-R-19]